MTKNYKRFGYMLNPPPPPPAIITTAENGVHALIFPFHN